MSVSPSPLLQTFFGTAVASSTTQATTKSALCLPDLRGFDDNHDMLTQVMGQTSYSDSEPTQHKFPCIKKRIVVLLKPI